MTEEGSCAVCGNLENLKRCVQCKKVLYCKIDCQRQHWPKHKSFCISEKKKRLQKEANEKVDNDDEGLLLDLPKPPSIDIFIDGNEKPHEYFERRLGCCGTHENGDRRAGMQVHALNNMAGGHKIDIPLDDEGNDDIYNDLEKNIWWKCNEDKTLGNGIIVFKDSLIRRTTGHGVLGTGLMIYGKMKLSDEITIDAPGENDFTYEFKEETKLYNGLTIQPGGYLDAFSVYHGPLSYKGETFLKCGGVHYNGTAFLHDGNRKHEEEECKKLGPPYKEICVDLKYHKE